MPMYGFSDPDWEDRLWYGMGFGRQIAVNPVLPNVKPIAPSWDRRPIHRTAGIATSGADMPYHIALGPLGPGEKGLQGTFSTTGAEYVLSGQRAPYTLRRQVPSTVPVYSSVNGSVSGWSLDDLVPDPIKQAASSIWDGVSKVAKDFANTTVGEVVLTALASAVTSGLVPILGPQLATIAFAIPGVLRGEPVDQAWVKEWSKRVTMTASIMAPQIGQSLNQIVGAFGDQLNTITQGLGKLPAVQKAADLAGDLGSLAAKFGVRMDVAAFAKDLFDRNINLPTASQAFDAMTGKLLHPAAPVTPATKPVHPISMPTVTMPAAVSKAMAYLAPSTISLSPGDRYTKTSQLWARYVDAAHGNVSNATTNFLADFNSRKIIPATVSAPTLKLVNDRLAPPDYYTAVNALWNWQWSKHGGNVPQANLEIAQLVQKGPIMTVADIQAQITQVQNQQKGLQAQIATFTALAANSAFPIGQRIAYQSALTQMKTAMTQLGNQLTSLRAALAQAQKAPQPITDPAVLRNMIASLKRNMVLWPPAGNGMQVKMGLIAQIQQIERFLKIPVERTNDLLAQSQMVQMSPAAMRAIGDAPPSQVASIIATHTAAATAAMTPPPAHPALMTRVQWIQHYNALKSQTQPAQQHVSGHMNMSHLAGHHHHAGISRFVAGCP